MCDLGIKFQIKRHRTVAGVAQTTYLFGGESFEKEVDKNKQGMAVLILDYIDLEMC